MNSKWLNVFKTTAAIAVCFVGLTSVSQAATYSFSTADSQFDAGVNNQGWWADKTSNSDSNSNVLTGYNSSTNTYRSFFTFDLSGLSLAANEEIVSASFSGNTHSTYGIGTTTETIGFFDVSTDAATLNNNSGLSSSIFNDLGTGAQYGSYDFTEQSDNIDFNVALNSAFFANAASAQGGFFSLGASLLTWDAGTAQAIFSFSSDNPAFGLTLETRISAVPLPAALPLYGAGIAVLGFMGWRRKKASS